MATIPPRNRNASTGAATPVDVKSLASPPTAAAFEISSDETTYAADDSKALHALISIPPEEDLAVRLVKLETVLRWRESKGDFTWAIAFTTLFAGAALGVVVNWATGSDAAPTRASKLLLLLLLLVSAGCGLWSNRLAKRAGEAWDTLNRERNSTRRRRRA